MQLRYVFSETGTGLRRNVSMSIALIVTIFVSLTLVGMGLLLNSQADKAEKFWGSKLQIKVFMGNQNSRVPHPSRATDNSRATPTTTPHTQSNLATTPRTLQARPRYTISLLRF